MAQGDVVDNRYRNRGADTVAGLLCIVLGAGRGTFVGICTWRRARYVRRNSNPSIVDDRNVVKKTNRSIVEDRSIGIW